jgi:hypothetical protein
MIPAFLFAIMESWKKAPRSFFFFLLLLLLIYLSSHSGGALGFAYGELPRNFIGLGRKELIYVNEFNLEDQNHNDGWDNT